MSPDFLPPASCDFSHASKGKWPLSRAFFLCLFQEKPSFSLKRPFSLSLAWENRSSRGVENRGSLISVPLALRETCQRLSLGNVNGRLLYYHYWCWRVGGAVPVNVSTGYERFPEIIASTPEIIASTGAKFWLRFCLSVLALVIFKSPSKVLILLRVWSYCHVTCATKLFPNCFKKCPIL